MNETNPQTVYEAHIASFTGRMNMITAATHCGLTLREFKMTFREFLKYNPPSYTTETASQLELF